ncbi:MAG: two-component hybrid sensor and regulator [Phycisphaerales bacterium]|jgi:PAS domain S-box-containing protein|nr:two-component hybrid sensor and regulator [Phycisphaerales bacterium]MDB5353734.1 two-component hybrid sensor and regulator [Phycisphaerales bacterium]
MERNPPTLDGSRLSYSELRSRLEVAEETLRAIRANEVDALVVAPGGLERLCTLQGTDEPYRVFVEAMAQGAATIAVDGTVLYSNRHFAQTLGFSPEEVIGTSVYRFVTPEDEGHLRAMLWEALGGCVRRDFELLASDGRAIPFSLSANPLILDGANLVCLLAQDLAEARARMAAEAESQAARGMAEELRRARDQAEAANRAKDDFLATITHELRTPLGAVLLWAKLLKAGMLSEKEKSAALDTIIRCASEQSRLVEDLLDASRIAHDKIMPDEQPVKLGALVQMALDSVIPAAKAKGVTLEAAVAHPQPIVLADAGWMQQAVANLLSNAVKFTPAGGRVEVKLDRRGGEAVLEVADNGDGIDPELLPHVFEKFWQADNTINRKHGGLGLGLSIVKNIVDRHGGSIRAKSDGVGRGAAFTVTLPLMGRSKARKSAGTAVGCEP